MAILFIAALLRLMTVPYNHYREDEAKLSTLAQGIVANGNIPLLGISSSVGVPNSPFTAYFMVIPYLFSTSPLVATIYVVIWNVIGVAALWLLAQRAFSTTVAHFAALIYAISPWAVWFSSKIWAQDFNAPVILVGLLLAWIGFVEGNRKAQIASFPILFIGFQLHFAGWALLPLVLFFIWVGRKRTTLIVVAISLVLAVATLVPFWQGLTQRQGNDTNHLTAIAGNIIAQADNPTLQGLARTISMITDTGIDKFVGAENWQDMDRVNPYPSLLAAVLGILAIVGLIAVWRFKIIAALFVVLWFLLPVLVFAPHWIAAPIYYFTASIPACCLLQAIGLDFIRKYARRVPWIAMAMATGVLLLLCTQILWWQNTLNYIDTKKSIVEGTPLHYMMELRQQFTPQSDILLTADSQEGYFGYQVWQAFLFGANSCLRPAIIPTGGIVLPEHPFATLQVPGAEHSSVSGFFTSHQVSTITLRPGEGAFTVFSYDRAPEWKSVKLNAVNAMFDNGIQLIGYANQDGKIYLRWKVATPPERDYQFFIHVVDAQGNRIGQRDTTLYQRRYLCTNDELITWTDVPTGPQAKTIHVGMYELLPTGGFQNSNLIDESGSATGQWVTLPLYLEF